MLTDIQKWRNYRHLDSSVRDEMDSLSEEELHECFYQNLAFGTGGMRGILGPGTNRMNVYTIRKASLGFGRYLKHTFHGKKLGIVISYDLRHKSELFAQETSRVFASLGFKVHLFKTPRPTPQTSFTIRHLSAIAGVMITASHNPPNYNGYKIYDEHGCQLVPEKADKVIEEIDDIKDIFKLYLKSFDAYRHDGDIVYIEDDLDQPYLDLVNSVTKDEGLDKSKIQFTYTPLHGLGMLYGEKLLKAHGYNVTAVKEQMRPDPDFSTVKSPNPEAFSAFDYSIKLGQKIKADVLFATDPDADRLGITVLHQGEYILLSGSQVGALFMEYLLQTRPRYENSMLITTIVTADLAAEIARKNNMEVIYTFTGFKFIADEIRKYEGLKKMFFSFEESIGYLLHDNVRDKDAFQALVVLAEMATYYHNREKTLIDALDDIYVKYGYYQESVLNIVLEGSEGQAKIQDIMLHLGKNPFHEIAGYPLVAWEDYQEGVRYEGGKKIDLPLHDSLVYKYYLADGDWFVFRPSGTEPKLKIYLCIKENSLEQSSAKMHKISQSLQAFLKSGGWIN